MLDLFPPGEEFEFSEEMADAMIAEGHLEVVDEGPPRRFRLTEEGIRYTREVIFPQYGVSEAEAMAWLDERLR
jgi:hypothetical protein